MVATTKDFSGSNKALQCNFHILHTLQSACGRKSRPASSWLDYCNSCVSEKFRFELAPKEHDSFPPPHRSRPDESVIYLPKVEVEVGKPV